MDPKDAASRYSSLHTTIKKQQRMISALKAECVFLKGVNAGVFQWCPGWLQITQMDFPKVLKGILHRSQKQRLAVCNITVMLSVPASQMSPTYELKRVQF